MKDILRMFICFFSREFLQREQYPFVDAQAGVSSKTYHWINHNRSTSKPGSLWYLISIDWWTRWEASATVPYADASNHAMHKKNSSTKLNKLSNGTDYR